MKKDFPFRRGDLKRVLDIQVEKISKQLNISTWNSGNKFGEERN